jgi:hypothetical protein
MTEVIHGLVSGLIWSAILGTCLIAFAPAITAMVPARARVRRMHQGHESRSRRTEMRSPSVAAVPRRVHQSVRGSAVQ